ncbi:high frequency lysogenization protein [Methylomarinovum caldicuralii]|uniref:High frequency lysogenization protein HflD homolog n=1 Tax=Methylomarinovum caldicuralii TaxID=438856 RepID=A0AAU9BTP8_9GAMM|nr:high frequency lysogenization protein HflD [Methylomarinovum caldicuralii]BCX82293.1 high frequency lysogenization protein [Methylomarinovum caldicuralii]
MLQSTRNQAIALAGLSQAIDLVQQVAKTGEPDEAAMATSIASTLKVDAASTEDVYGGLKNLRPGLEILRRQLGAQGQIDPEHARYSAQLMLLQGKLSASTEARKRVRAGVERAAAIARDQGVLDETVLEILADTYHEHISPLGPKIIITGERRHLSERSNACRIRALLLAGIRSALLWRQCGGARWKFLFNRKRLLHEVDSLLREINAD